MWRLGLARGTGERRGFEGLGAQWVRIGSCSV